MNLLQRLSVDGPESIGRRLRQIAVLVLFVGLGSALWIALAADSAPTELSDFDVLANKRYVRELELYGGKFNVMAAEFSRWFAGLWHGRRLGLTVGAISLVLASLLWYIGDPGPSGHDDASEPDTGQNGPSV